MEASLLVAVRGCSASFSAGNNLSPPTPRGTGHGGLFFLAVHGRLGLLLTGVNILFPLHDNVGGTAAIFLLSAVAWSTTLVRATNLVLSPCVETHGAYGCSSV